ncbi:hypothetical protein [Mameliella sp. MMSF_3510]|uniref:hypothetical protein n=1 Tax=Mameliella sp. MMSF_3510 TaxID=3046718 RepID=UPI00273E3261|nr:hypothetical protein [Mameliella sp. MMSF_3510]
MLSTLVSVLGGVPKTDAFPRADQRDHDQSEQIQWSLGHGWWILPVALLGLHFWIVVIRWFVGLMFPN